METHESETSVIESADGQAVVEAENGLGQHVQYAVLFQKEISLVVNRGRLWTYEDHLRGRGDNISSVGETPSDTTTFD